MEKWKETTYSTPSVYCVQYILSMRELALTTAGGGLPNRWGDHQISLPFLGGITKFQVPTMGGSQNPICGGGEDKMHLMWGDIIIN